MPLVDYADSDDSDGGEKPLPEKTSSKPTFQKVINRANPHKIRVTLSELSKSTSEDGENEAGPPAKRAKVSSGGLSGFNSFLPAPKRAAVTNGDSGRGRLGGGVNLKTGAAPGFSREVNSDIGAHPGDYDNAAMDELGSRSVEDNPMSMGVAAVRSEEAQDKTIQDPKKQGNSVMFKPLSVARKSQKKKAPSPAASLGAHISHEITPQQSKTAPKAALFSIADVQESKPHFPVQKGEYKPLVYQAPDTNTEKSPPAPSINPYREHIRHVEEPVVQTTTSHPDVPQSLNTIAADLNLSASAKRQLFGRQGNNPSAINIVNFNTDQEYAANEILRQNGEQVQHNPVRALAAGKHSLKQLVNAASNQKDALEEQFASGRRNKEAGSKYGW